MRQQKTGNKVKKDIILSGVGGQGILSIATVIGWAALKEDLHLKQAEVHGMSQRGGDVQSNLRISSEHIFSDLIPKGECDIILSLEPMEAMRYLPWLSRRGWIVTNTTPFVNIPNYPPMEDLMLRLEVLPNVITLDCDSIARETGSPRSSNMVLLGASAAVMDIIAPDRLREGITAIFARKGDAIVKSNIAAFNAGLEMSKSIKK